MTRNTLSEEEYTLPSTEALLAGTLALMTGCAQGGGEHRSLLEAKVAANLAQLCQHDALSPNMRLLLARLQLRWQATGHVHAEASPAPVHHLPPSLLQ